MAEEFGKFKPGVNVGGEVMGENEHGCFSLISGQFIPKDRKGYAYFAPETSKLWPCDDDDKMGEDY